MAVEEVLVDLEAEAAEEAPLVVEAVPLAVVEEDPLVEDEEDPLAAVVDEEDQVDSEVVEAVDSEVEASRFTILHFNTQTMCNHPEVIASIDSKVFVWKLKYECHTVRTKSSLCSQCHAAGWISLFRIGGWASLQSLCQQ